MAYRNVRPAVALLAWVIVKLPLVTALTYMVPLPTSAAALAVVGVNIGVDPEAQFAVATVVVAAPVSSVTEPTAFDLPAASCWIERTIFFRSVSVIPGVYAVTACHLW
jgi:hypothetical protein